MKYPISVAFLLLVATIGKAQSAHSLADLPAVTINLEHTEDLARHPGVFSHFEVIDERPDTARIGIHNFTPFLLHSRNRQLVFQHTASQEIADYLNTRFAQPGAPWSALIVLRHLWLSDANYIGEAKVKNPAIREERTHIRLKAEIYAFKDSLYLPLVRYDTTQTYKRKNTYNNLTTYYALWDQDLSTVLSLMADSAAGLVAAKARHSRHLQWGDILQFNRSRFDAKIIQTPALTPGVYANFGEFRNNTPSIPHFEIRKEDQDLLLYIQDANGSFFYSHDVWGYCDGRSVFIMRDGKLYRLWKEGKGFYFFNNTYKETGYNNYIPSRTPAVNTAGALAPPSKPQHIYAVDMDSGAAY